MIPHRPFALVLGGGGARGFAHLGVLRALEHEGLRPESVVGVSMGAVVGVTYVHRDDWYEAVLGMDVSEFPGPVSHSDEARHGGLRTFRSLISYLRALSRMALGWGVAEDARRAGLVELRKLFGGRRLEDGRIPVAVAATDLRSGARVVLREGDAVDSVYASAALAGVLPPLSLGDHLLADGAYTDLAPVDVARQMGSASVIAVDPGQASEPGEIRNGFQAVMRAMDICHRQHAHLRFAAADLVLRPQFKRAVDTLDFGARRECVAAGVRAVRRARSSLRQLLLASAGGSEMHVRGGSA